MVPPYFVLAQEETVAANTVELPEDYWISSPATHGRCINVNFLLHGFNEFDVYDLRSP